MANTATTITTRSAKYTAQSQTAPDNQAILHLLHLGSSALPVGAFAYSQGLEYAIDSGWLQNGEQIQDWISAVMGHGLCQLDVPVLLRISDALERDQLEQAQRWSQLLLAGRETHELRQEDGQIGAALRRLLRSLGLEIPTCWQQGEVSQVAMLALAARYWQLDPLQVANSLLWGFAENQIAVASKVLPLGQTEAQRILLALMPGISRGIETAAEIPDDSIGATLPGQVMASSRHETQYSRLFRS